MGFPISITGQVIIPAHQLPYLIDASSRLEEALISETVDGLRRRNNSFSFRHRAGFHETVPRPGGSRWLFDGLDAGSFELSEDAVALTVRYRLSTRHIFLVVSALAIGIGSVIHLSSGPDHEWGFAFGVGLWLVMFALQYYSTTIEIRRWLRKIMTAAALPAPAALIISAVD